MSYGIGSQGRPQTEGHGKLVCVTLSQSTPSERNETGVWNAHVSGHADHSGRFLEQSSLLLTEKNSWGWLPLPPPDFVKQHTLLKETVDYHLPFDFSLSAGFI